MLRATKIAKLHPKSSTSILVKRVLAAPVNCAGVWVGAPPAVIVAALLVVVLVPVAAEPPGAVDSLPGPVVVGFFEVVGGTIAVELVLGEFVAEKEDVGPTSIEELDVGPSGVVVLEDVGPSGVVMLEDVGPSSVDDEDVGSTTLLELLGADPPIH
jgi:hypothetical protein